MSKFGKKKTKVFFRFKNRVFCHGYHAPYQYRNIALAETRLPLVLSKGSKTDVLKKGSTRKDSPLQCGIVNDVQLMKKLYKLFHWRDTNTGVNINSFTRLL